MAEGGHSLRYFSGDDADHREYKRWKQWAQNKMLVMDKLPKEARGSFVWTLLQGRALEVVEHLREADYQKEGGDKVLFDLLNQRWPEKDRADELGEHVSEVFLLRAKEGESIRQWCARAREVFDRCYRKTGVQFPDEARGWIVLNSGGMSEEQRAVVLARCHGSLKFEEVAQAMRSCYPEFTVPKRRGVGVHYTEHEDESWWADNGDYDVQNQQEDSNFEDVELFLAEYDAGQGFENDEAFPETEVAEVLAASWKDKRQELSRLQRARRFTQAKDVRRSFRVEVEELKRRTKCHRCGKTGHWARECKLPRAQGTASASGAASSTAGSSGAGLVQAEVDFVCYVENDRGDGRKRLAGTARSMLDQLRDRMKMPAHDVLLVSSPGYAILDSGCGRSIVGQETLQQFRQIWKDRGVTQPTSLSERNVFRYGNGEQEITDEVVEMPVVIGGKKGIVRAAVVKGKAPLLMSKQALKRLRASMDFESDELTLFAGEMAVPMMTNEAGQYMIPVAEFSQLTPDEEKEPTSVAAVESLSVEATATEDYWEVHGHEVIRYHVLPRRELFTPSKAQCPVPVSQLDSRRTTVFAASHADASETEMSDVWKSRQGHAAQNREWTGRTVFRILPPPACLPEGSEVALCQWTSRQRRQLQASTRRLMQGQSQTPGQFRAARKGPRVVEVFSPPRFAQVLTTKGIECVSADLVTGWDFRLASHRDSMRALVRDSKPDLLVLCPPCTWAGGWYHYNRMFMSPEEIREKDRLTCLFANFSAELAQIQLDHDGRVLFEHPRGSLIWKLPRLVQLRNRMHEVRLDMCRYGMSVPEGLPIRKRTTLLVSHANMRSLQRQCQGGHDHQVIAGSHPKVGSLSKYAGQYPKGFVRAVLRTVKELPDTACLVQAGSDHECLAAARIQQLNEQKRDQMLQSLYRLHCNLGHPPVAALMRVLKHGGASTTAIELARELSCDVCRAQGKPSTPPPAQTHRATMFNERIGVDIKYLPGWKPNLNIPCVNIVDYASSFQMVVPLESKETSASIRRTILDRWVSWAGVPQEIVVDPAQPNISDAMTVPQELSGSKISTTAAEAHWQLGKVEVHGGWFQRILKKVLADTMPHDRETWLECVTAAHCKNELIQTYGMTPAQFVFGRNPHVPSNLLDEPLNVVPATAALYEESVQRSIAIRQSARKALIELQDCKALRAALAARPRKVTPFHPGDSVAYWRTQKVREGHIEFGGRWHGPAVVLGYVGRNVVVVHKRQILRCAPEQVRMSTVEEVKLGNTPSLELLGIKNLLNEGGLQSSQYIDLVPQQAPPQAPEASAPASATQELPVATPETARVTTTSQPATWQEQFRSEHAGQGASSTPAGVNPEESSGVHNSVADHDASGYGPVRRRMGQKGSPSQLYRPCALLQDDFAEMMQELVPRLVTQAIETQAEDSDMPATVSSSASVPDNSAPAASSSARGSKREASVEASQEGKRQATGPVNVASEAMSDTVGDTSSADLPAWESLLAQAGDVDQEFEALVAAHINKRAAKEIPATGNDVELQHQVDEAKLLEWQTVSGRHATRLVLGREAAEVRRRFADRIMGSRYVCTWKQEEEGPKRVKARWCLQGHLDPDLQQKAEDGDLQSPTLSQVGRALTFQLIASFRWKLMLGDVKGAFLSSGDLPARFRPLYARLPAGGIPGVPNDALIEVLGHVYGLNDAPSAWYKTLDQALKEAGFERSRFDRCLYYMRDQGKLIGVFGVHVDDSVTGGLGEKYDKALAFLKKRFEFRKWRIQDGDFCGARYVQDPDTFEVTMSQEAFVSKIRPLHLSRKRAAEKASELTADETRCLRAINGSLNWLATQSRPDLSTQVSFSQQSFPRPTVSDALAANQAVRRARQHSAMQLVYRSISPTELTIMSHSDAAYANGRDGATQAGYVVSYTSKLMHEGQTCCWTPAFWKSYRLPRVVNSTLSAEAQAMTMATGMCEWALLLLSEALDGRTFLQAAWQQAKLRPCLVVTDCKSLFDHVTSQSAPTLDDRRTALDIVILRESLVKTGGVLRWIPTDRMLADALTKESPEAFDLIRACIREGQYQISPESTVLQWRSQERERRKERAASRKTNTSE